MKQSTRYKITGLFIASIAAWAVASATYKDKTEAFQAPEMIAQQEDSVVTQSQPENLRFPLKDASGNPHLESEEGGIIDLGMPSNLEYRTEYDPETQQVTVYRNIGGMDVRLPYTMTLEEYLDVDTRKSMINYWHQRQQMENGQYSGNSIFNQKFKLGGEAFNSIFGSNMIDIKMQGMAELKVGFSTNKVDNPTLQERLRKTTTFDFEENIQMNINGNIGDKMKLGINYNTQALFDFENQVKLEYTGKEDEILKKVEAGNVSLPLPGTLITGSQSLFGIKTEMKFGRLTMTSIFSQQKGESKVINVEGGASKQEFEVTVDQYDRNRHFFLAHPFRDKYNEALSTLPIINSGYNIERIEVWVTNKAGNFDESRNIVAFLDLAERDGNIHNTRYWQNGDVFQPDNQANTLYDAMDADSARRDINKITQELLNYDSLYSGIDYEKVESARLLKPSEYTVNYKLGYISLNSSLQADEVLAVAYEYSYQGEIYKVGDLSNDGISAPRSLFVKLLKGTALTPEIKTWNLMMKNIYSLNAYQVNRDEFKLDIVLTNDSTGSDINFFPEGEEKPNGINKEILLNVFNLDKLNSQNEPLPDGIFDFLEGITILSQSGRVIFPVLEPFGKHLESQLNDEKLRKKYVYSELYNKTQTEATQATDKNRFRLVGSYKSSGGGGEISLNAMNVPRGSVVVTAGGIKLIENVDYTVDYSMGRVKILNQGYLNSGTPIQVSLESQSLYNLQTKTLMGTHFDYEVNDKFNLGATLMHLRERPLTQKVNIGSEPIANTIWGLNGTYNTESQALTNWVDKLPLVVATQPSNITFEGEFAHLIPGHPNVIEKEGNAYIDDFEGTKISYDIKYPSGWRLASVPQGQDDIVPNSHLINDLKSGFGRAKIAWYTIDPMFLRKTSTTPSHISDDIEQQSNHFVREIFEKELFPDKNLAYGAQANIPMLNIAYYPNERGPYNYSTDSLDYDGKFMAPETKWGGIMREINIPDFEAANIENIEFWIMDPFVYDSSEAKGGDIYFNLGNISEDILRDSRKSFENGLPAEGEADATATTSWGRVATKQSISDGFSTIGNSRQIQDVGFDGLPNSGTVSEELHFKDFTNKINNANLSTDAKNQILGDPSSDDYHHFRGSKFDEDKINILDRYKNYNNNEGNSVATENSPESYSTAAYSYPDAEDINKDNTLSETESYFQYKVSLKPDEMNIGQNYITNVVARSVKLKNGKTETVKWYQFKIPISTPDDTIGIVDKRSIRFMRLFMHNFTDTTILRFASMDLVRGEWRKYTQQIDEEINPIVDPDKELVVSAVNIEEDAARTPVNYILPPGIDRVVDPSNPQMQELNEQSISLKAIDLKKDDAVAVYKTLLMDMRQYKRIKMEIHAEEIEDQPINGMKAFIRLGADSKNNYYEYEIPLTATPPGSYSDNTEGRLKVWPVENRLDVPLDIFTKAKLERNNKKDKKLGDRYPMQDGANYAYIKGNPNLGNIKTIMIGIRNARGEDKSVEVWFNELRLTDFDEDGGWAANARMKIDLSDLGSISMAGKTSSQGFGSIDQSVTQRSQEDFYQYDIATNIEAGKLLGPKSRLSVPFYYGFSKAVTTPKYNPLDEDITLKQSLKEADSKSEKDSIKNISQTVVDRKSINVSNLRITPKQGGKPSVISPSNLSATYSFNETKQRDVNTEYAVDKNHRGNIAYNYSVRPKPVEPFKKTKAFSSKSLSLIRDFNFNYLPSRIGYRMEVVRLYTETQLRNISSPDFRIPVTVRKDFHLNRYFDLKFDLTKSLSFDFKATTNASIDEPDGPVNKDRYKDEYDHWRDTVMQNILSLGRTTNYRHTTNASYRVPINKIPLLDWTSLDLRYGSSYTWLVGPTITRGEVSPIGNTIQNSNNIQIKPNFKFKTLYSKSSYLKNLDKKYNSRSSRSSGSQQKKRTERYNKNNIELEAGKPYIVNHRLKTEEVKLRIFNSSGRPVEGETKVINGNKIEFTSVESHEGARVSVTGTIEDVNTPLKVITDYTALLLTGFKTMNIQYTSSNGTILPGYMEGSDWSSAGFSKPGVPFVFGYQDRDFAKTAGEKGWLSPDSMQTNPYLMTHSEDFTIKATFEPFRGFKISFSADRKMQKNLNEYYIWDNNSSFTQENTRYRGNFNMSFNIFRTSFWKIEKSGLYQSKAYDNFLAYRHVIADRLGQSRNGMADNNPDIGGIYNPEIDAPAEGGVNGYSLNSQEVLIPAFLAAYSDKDPNKIFLTAFPGLDKIQPNWRFTYDGLSRIKWIKKSIKTFNISHAYRSSYSVGSFVTNYENIDEIRDALIWRRDLQNNFIPGYQINSVTLREQFSPLIQFNITWQNSITTKAELKRTRVLNLSLTNNQLIENYTNEIVVGLGYRLDQLNLNIGNNALSSDVNFRADLSIRENLAIIRKLEEGVDQLTSGNKAITVKFTADYALSDRFNMQLFYDTNVNKPYLSNSYPTSNSNFGLSFQFALTQ